MKFTILYVDVDKQRIETCLKKAMNGESFYEFIELVDIDTAPDFERLAPYLTLVWVTPLSKDRMFTFLLNERIKSFRMLLGVLDGAIPVGDWKGILRLRMIRFESEDGGAVFKKLLYRLRKAARELTEKRPRGETVPLCQEPDIHAEVAIPAPACMQRRPSSRPSVGRARPSLSAPSLSYGPDSVVPLGLPRSSLPRDGLYIRRNNAFGTKLSHGIKDLIDHGTLIDQTHIRFDDFVAESIDDLPRPEDGSAVRVSYGLSPIQGRPCVNPDSTHFLEIALRTSDSALNDAVGAAPAAVNYVFVVDTSGSMSGGKLDAVKNALLRLFEELEPSDIIGIVLFNHRASTLLKATAKRDIRPQDFGHLLGRIQCDGTTDINLGLSYGFDEIERNQEPRSVNQLYLFSDGNPNSGETDWIKIRQNIATRTRAGAKLSVFGFGSDANMRELDALAGTTGGTFTFVLSPEDVTANLQRDLNRRDTLVAMNLQMKLTVPHEVEPLYFFGHDYVGDPAQRMAVMDEAAKKRKVAEQQFGAKSHRDIICDEDGIRVFAPDLAAKEAYFLIFELKIPESTQPETVVASTVIQYADLFRQDRARHAFDITPNGNLQPEVVSRHALELWTSEVVFYALDDLYQQDTSSAQTRIDRHIQVLGTASAELSSKELRDDMVTLRKFSSLSKNLGMRINMAKDVHNDPSAYMIYALNAFGRVKNGFMMSHYSPRSS